jgi:hypothetical protein
LISVLSVKRLSSSAGSLKCCPYSTLIIERVAS